MRDRGRMLASLSLALAKVKYWIHNPLINYERQLAE